MLSALELAKYTQQETRRIQEDLEDNSNLAHAYYRSRGLNLFIVMEVAGLDPSTSLSVGVEINEQERKEIDALDKVRDDDS
jgi:hypothetical protein